MLTVNWDITSAQKGGYPFFMLKEIYEQPDAIRNTIAPRINQELPDFTEDGIDDAIFKDCKRISIVACGTAMHAGMVGKHLIEKKLRIPVHVDCASEFRYKDPIIDEETLTIVLSQSGETIDTLEALKLAKNRGSKVLSIVNVKGSTIARESDYVLYTHAGPEIAVASTKAYTVQVAAMYLIACRIGLVKELITEHDAKRFMTKLTNASNIVEETLKCADDIKRVADHIKFATDTFYIGRGLDYTMSLEAALKLKEISYVHAEAYAAGELKHGTIALISENVPVIALATQEDVYAKVISNIRENRGSKVLSIVNVKGSTIARESDYVLYTHAGPEIAVASTKAYTVQVAAMYLIACRIGLVKELITEHDAKRFMTKLTNASNIVEETLKCADDIKRVADHIKFATDTFYIGRGLDYTMSLEAALKLKEISYVHAEAYAAGELKHGTIALISENVPVIALATQEDVYAKVISNIREVKARGAYVVLVSMDEEVNDPSICDQHIRLPKMDSEFTSFATAVVLQLVAYYTSEAKGLDVDKPRNLAKSVTVE